MASSADPSGGFPLSPKYSMSKCRSLDNLSENAKRDCTGGLEDHFSRLSAIESRLKQWESNLNAREMDMNKKMSRHSGDDIWPAAEPRPVDRPRGISNVDYGAREAHGPSWRSTYEPHRSYVSPPPGFGPSDRSPKNNFGFGS